jgi:signal peptidase I
MAQKAGNVEKPEPSDEKRTTLAKLQESNALVFLFAFAFIAYLLTRHILFAFLSGVSLISIFGLDILVGATTHGLKDELIELVKAVAVALVIWYGIMFILNTSSPISGIVSCSLLPSYERGDMIILRGVSMGEINAPTVELTPDEFAQIYQKTNPSCGTIGPITYDCVESCPRVSFPGGKPAAPSAKCVRSLTFNTTAAGNFTINENLSDDVIVYAPSVNGRYASGDIIHRVFAKLKVGDKYFMLTKGDNNDFMDASVFDIIRQEDVKGRVLFRIPILGYLKLFISGYFAEPVGCDTALLH